MFKNKILVLMLLEVLYKCVVCEVSCKMKSEYRCLNNQNIPVGMCYRVKGKTEENCFTDPLTGIFDYGHRPCTPKQCEADFINHCQSADVCNNKGKCVNLIGTYTCLCDEGYHGRHCSERGESSIYVKGVYFFYHPMAPRVGINQALIFIKNRGSNLQIYFKSSSSGEVINIDESRLETTQNSKGICERFLDNNFLSDKFCESLSDEKLSYVIIHYDIVYSSDGESVQLDYNKKLKENGGLIAGYKVDTLQLKVYNNGKEQFNSIYNQTASYSRRYEFVCPTPVKFENCGKSSDMPRRYYKDHEILIRSYVKYPEDCLPTAEEKAQGKVPTRIFSWNIYKYESTCFEKGEPILRKIRQETDDDRMEYKIKKFEKVGGKYLDFGVYKVILQVNSTGKSEAYSGNYKTSYNGVCFIELYSRPLYVEIIGGATRTIYVNNNVVILDGSKSTDPNNPSDAREHLWWKWSNNGTGLSCKNGNTPQCEINIYGKLDVGQSVTFSLTVGTTDYSIKSKTVTQTLIVSQKPQVELEVICRKNCADFKTNPREVLYLEANSFNGVYKNFEWNLFVDGEETSLEQIKQTGVASQFLIIKKNCLKEGSKCVFSVSIKEVGVEGSTSSEISVVKPPTNVNCSILSGSKIAYRGIKGVTEFTITCSSFGHDDNSNQLSYEFYQRSESESAPGSLIGFSVTGELNEVILTAGRITVRVLDVYGMYTDFPLNVELEEPPAQDMVQMVEDLSNSVSEGDRLRSARIAGAIIDLSNKQRSVRLINNVLNILNTLKFSDFSDVKLFSSSLDRIVNGGVHKLVKGLDSKGVQLMGKLMASLTLRFFKEARKSDIKSFVMSGEDIRGVCLTMLNSSDAIIASEDESLNSGTSGGVQWFETHYHYRRGISSMIRSLGYSGKAVISNLLPHEKETVINSNNTSMWIKIDSPNELTKLDGIPDNSTDGGANRTKIKLSGPLGKFLENVSDTVAIEGVIFQNNPYWWDVQDKDVISEIASLRVWKWNTTELEPVIEIPTPVDIFLNVKTNYRPEVLLVGEVTMPRSSDSEDEKDSAVAVHTLEAPEENSNGKIFFEFENLRDEEFLVLITTNLRPDYEMMKEGKILSKRNSKISLTYKNVTANSRHFIGILPGPDVQNRTLHYSISMYSVQCKVRQPTVWTSPACTVAEGTVDDTVHCQCAHLSLFGSSIFVPPNSVHPIKDLYLFATLKDNPLVFSLVMVLLLLYLLLLMWALVQERRDKLKRKVIVLEDNYPGDEYPYLIVVYTAYNIGAATGSNVGVELVGEKEISRAHVLRSQYRRVFRRNADDWFLLFSPTHLGDLKAVHIWHDNSGSYPDWYCKKIKVYDITTDVGYEFLINQWLSTKRGEYPEILERAAKPHDVYDWRSVIVHNVIYNFQEKHLWLSIFFCHPRATVSKSQRLTMAFCIVMVAFLTGIMFYGVARKDRVEDEDKYEIKFREVVIAVESAIVSSLATSLVVTCFKRSQVIVPNQTVVRGSGSSSEKEKSESQQKPSKKTIRVLRVLSNFVRNSVRGKPLVPVLVGKESASSVIRRKRFAKAGWIISQIIIWGSSFFIVLYGLKLGKVMSELWLTSALICFVNGIFISAPLKILTISATLAFFGEMYNVTTFECEIEGAKQEDNFGDESYLSNLLYIRSSPIYHPLTSRRLKELRFTNESLERKLQCFELIATVVFLLALFNFTKGLWREKNFYINSHIDVRLTSNPKSPSIGLHDVINIDKLTEYVIVTLLPSLFREKWYNNASLTSDAVYMADMGWVSDTVHRLVGVPQLRQLRVKTKVCCFLKLFNITLAKCFPSLSKTCEDVGNYSLDWAPPNKYINKPLVKPFTYQMETADGSVMYGESGYSYHSGGYVVRMDDTQRKCNLIISDLIDNSWWDIRMRGFVVELTLYNPNTDSYSLVTIITEHLATGAVTNRIQTLTFHLSLEIVNFVLFFLLLITFNFRLLVNINRQGFFTTLSQFWGRYDVLLIGLCDVSSVFEGYKIIREATAVHVFQQYGGSDFFYFSNIVFYERVSTGLWCAVLVFAPLRIVKFKLFTSTCKAACYTVSKCRNLLLTLALLILITVVIQLFLFSFVFCPSILAFDVDTRFYKSHPSTGSSSSECSATVSLMFYAVCSVEFLILQVILIYTYKIMSDY